MLVSGLLAAGARMHKKEKMSRANMLCSVSCRMSARSCEMLLVKILRCLVLSSTRQ